MAKEKKMSRQQMLRPMRRREWLEPKIEKAPGKTRAEKILNMFKQQVAGDFEKIEAKYKKKKEEGERPAPWGYPPRGQVRAGQMPAHRHFR